MSGTSNIFNTGAIIVAPSGALLMPDYETAIGADPTTVEWWHPDADAITESGGVVSQLRTQKATGGTTLTAVTGSRPALLAAAVNGRNALRFQRNASEPPDRFAYTFPAGAALSWTKIMVIRDYGPLQGELWSTDGTNAHRISFVNTVNDGDHVLARGGASLASSALFKPRPLNAWFLVMQSFDHVAGRVALSVNGGSWILGSAGVTVDVTASNIGARPSETSNNTGGQFDAAMIALDSTALHLAGNAAKLTLWKQLVRDDFALTIA